MGPGGIGREQGSWVEQEEQHSEEQEVATLRRSHPRIKIPACKISC